MPSICDLKPGETALDALSGMAAVTTAIINISQPTNPLVIKYLTTHHNYSVSWRPSRLGIPPYVPGYLEVIGSLSAREKSAAKRQVLATDMMNKYYTAKIQPLPQDKTDAQNAIQRLHNQAGALDKLRTAVANKSVNLAQFCKAASEIAAELGSICEYLTGLDPSMAGIDCIAKSAAYCQGVISATRPVPPDRPEVVNAVVTQTLRDLPIVIGVLTSILIGYATVTNNQTIPSFILLRLLVGYRLDLSQPDDRLYISVVSAQLTALLHGQQKWLFNLMQNAIADIAGALAPFDGRVCFFLKGGRGLNYLLGDSSKGENDWDTQILLNPELSVEDWWGLYGAVASALNNCLLRSSFVFSANLMANAPTLIASVKSVGDNVAKSPAIADQTIESIFMVAWQYGIDDQSFAEDRNLAMALAWQETLNPPSGNCKAELIDVGLPRYYSIELLEQWTHTQPSLDVSAEGIPYPTAEYFIDELIAMIRENDAGVSPSPAKRTKRLNRLLSLLSPQVTGFNAFLSHEQELAVDSKLDATNRIISGIANEQIRALAAIMLGQFCTAYQLYIDLNLAAAFDQLAAPTLDQAIKRSAASTASIQANAVFEWCQQTSNTMMSHLNDRGQFLLGLASAIETLVSQTVTASKSNVSPVFVGPFAICIYAQVLQAIVKNQVAPAEFATIRLYYQDCASISNVPPNTLSGLASSIAASITNSTVFGSICTSPQTNSIAIFAKQSIPLASGSYQPLLVEFVIKASAQVPTLTRPTLTLLGLPALTSSCRERAASVTEWAMRQKLSETFGALIEMQAAGWKAGPAIISKL